MENVSHQSLMREILTYVADRSESYIDKIQIDGYSKDQIDLVINLLIRKELITGKQATTIHGLHPEYTELTLTLSGCKFLNKNNG